LIFLSYFCFPKLSFLHNFVVLGDFIDEQDWLNYKKKIKKTQKAEGKKSGKNKRTLSEILHRYVF